MVKYLRMATFWARMATWQELTTSEIAAADVVLPVFWFCVGIVSTAK